MQTGPTEEVATQADHRILGGVQTNVTLEGAVLVTAVGRRGAAGSGTRVVGSRGGASGRRGSSGGHLFKLRSAKRGRGGDSSGTQQLKMYT